MPIIWQPPVRKVTAPLPACRPLSRTLQNSQAIYALSRLMPPLHLLVTLIFSCFLRSIWDLSNSTCVLSCLKVMLLRTLPSRLCLVTTPRRWPSQLARVSPWYRIQATGLFFSRLYCRKSTACLSAWLHSCVGLPVVLLLLFVLTQRILRNLLRQTVSRNTPSSGSCLQETVCRIKISQSPLCKPLLCRGTWLSSVRVRSNPTFVLFMLIHVPGRFLFQINIKLLHVCIYVCAHFRLNRSLAGCCRCSGGHLCLAGHENSESYYQVLTVSHVYNLKTLATHRQRFLYSTLDCVKERTLHLFLALWSRLCHDVGWPKGSIISS